MSDDTPPDRPGRSRDRGLLNHASGASSRRSANQKEPIVNSIIWWVGLIVIVLFILGYFGLG
jgi:hypothetical protein